MATATLPKTDDDLTEKERRFYDAMQRGIPEPARLVAVGTSHICLYFDVPKDFTQDEFDRVGHRLTCLFWNWEELGGCGNRLWKYILFPL